MSGLDFPVPTRIVMSDLLFLDKENVSKLTREMNPDTTDAEVEDVIHALNLTGSGSVTFAEMKKALIGDKGTSAST